MKNLTKDLIMEQIELDEMNDYIGYDQFNIEYTLRQEINDSNIEIQKFISKSESHLGFSLNDDDASEKLNQLSNIIEIPDVLYQYVA